MECHVGDHIHTPFLLDAILDSDARMRRSLDFRRCGNVLNRRSLEVNMGIIMLILATKEVTDDKKKIGNVVCNSVQS